MNTNKLVTLSLLILVVGCASETDKSSGKQDQRALAVVPAGSGIDGCQNVQTICTASYPSTCYDFCGDEPPECNKVEVCTMSYPSTCHEICEGPTEPIGDCGGQVSSAVDSDGNEYPICISDPGGTGGGTSTCTKVTICEMTYPEICHDVCQEDLDGGGVEPQPAPGTSSGS